MIAATFKTDELYGLPLGKPAIYGDGIVTEKERQYCGEIKAILSQLLNEVSVDGKYSYDNLNRNIELINTTIVANELTPYRLLVDNN